MKRIMIVLLALLLLIPVTGCGGRLAAKVKQAQSEEPVQFVSFDESTDARILFRDDFEDGDLDGWQTTGPWGVEQDGEDNVLVVTGSAESAWVPEGVRWTDYYVRAGVKLESGGVSLSFRNSSEGSYWLLYRSDGLYLIKESPKGNFTALTQTDAPRLSAWHILAIGGYGGHLQVYVDTELQMDYMDSSPITQGTIGVASMDSAAALVDNVMAVKLLEDLDSPAAGSELPATVVAPSASALEEEWEPLEEWIPLDEEPLPLVEPTSTPAGESSWSEDEGPPPLVEPTSTPAGESEWSGEEWTEEEWSDEEIDWSEDEWPEGELEWSDEDPPPGDLPVIDYFYAEAIEDRPGCYYIHWDLHDADAAFLNGQGITAPGDGEACEPGTYTLRAENVEGSVEETITITAEGQIDEPTTQPDLEITEVVTTPNPNNPNRVRVEIRVANNGNAPTAPFTIRWFPHRSEDVVGCSVDASGLAAHDSGRARCSYTYPNHGEMHWMAVVDQDNEIVESDDDNNTYTGSVVIERGSGGSQQQSGGKPDLELTSFDVRTGLVPNDPLTVRLFAEVTNVGDAASAPFTLRWYPSQGSDQVGWSQDFPALEPGVSYPYDGGFTYAAAGEYRWRVIVDEDDEVDEVVEQENNRDSGTVQVGEQGDQQGGQGGDLPDLMVANMHTNPSQMAPGQTGVIARFIVQNKGEGAAGPSHVLWYMGNVTYWSGGCEVPALDAGGYYQCEVELGPVPASADGVYDQVAIADSGGDIAESNEDNNQLTHHTATVVADGSGDKPDLIPTGHGLRGVDATNLLEMEIEISVRNGGLADAGPFKVVWYPTNSSDVIGCTKELPDGLPKGEVETLICRYEYPEAGEYTSLVMVDPEDAIDEWNEDNNSSSFTFHAGPISDQSGSLGESKPDLVVRDLDLSPNPVIAAHDLLIEYEVVNQGSGLAPASQAEWALPPAAELSVPCNVPELSAGESFRCRQQIPAPSRKARYGNKATADVGNVVNEGTGTGEDNNVLRGETLAVQ